MRVFAIKHKPSNTFMPARMFKAHGAGWSYWEPNEAGKEQSLDGFDKNPRIFFTKQSVDNALTAWLRGPYEKHEHAGGWDDPMGGYTSHEPTGAPLQSRVREDMLIVPMELTEISGG